MNLIACVDKNWGIGYKGNLLTRIPEDMKLFRKLTLGKPIIMGRKTMESLPNHYLDNRTNIVLSHNNIDNPNIILMKSIEDLLCYKKTHSKDYSENDYWVIGGSEIYKSLLEYCDTAYITFVNNKFDNVDSYIPNLYDMGFTDQWISGHNTTPDGFQYRFHTLTR